MTVRFFRFTRLLIAPVLMISCLGAEKATASSSDQTLPSLTAIAGQGVMNGHAFDYLEELSDQIGGRVTGSPQAQVAVEWGLTTLRKIGLENVHAENWQMARGWKRISANAELLAPARRRLTIDSMGWVGSTPAGGVDADVLLVDVDHFGQGIDWNASQWADKVLFAVRTFKPPTEVEQAEDFATFGRFLDAAYAAHAIAVIGGQSGSEPVGMHLTHTGVMGYNRYFDIPVVSMTAEDQRLLKRFLFLGKKVRVKINVQNESTTGPVNSANVIGEIRGEELSKQVVVAGAHLDSWDLASGATDDGTGVATTLGAAEAIVSSGHRPRRTIRFILFTGEEQGLLGSFAYVRSHQLELSDHVAAIVIDKGPGQIVGLQLGGFKDDVPIVEQFAASLKAFGQLTVNDAPVFGTDCGPFTLAGLLGINLNQDSPEYKYTHHSAVDTLDKVKPELLARNATVMALTAFWIADRPDRLSYQKSPEETAKMLDQQKPLLKAYGLWPFVESGRDSAKQ